MNPLIKQIHLIVILLISDHGTLYSQMSILQNSIDGTDSAIDSNYSRVLILHRRSLTSFEGNAKTYLSLNQGIGRVSDYLGMKKGWDKNVSFRLTQFFTLAYYNLGIGHYSHELGHNVGVSNWKIDPKVWFEPFPWPGFKHGYCVSDCYYPPNHRVLDVVGGLNQEEWDAYVLFQKSQKEIQFDEGLAFIFRKLSGITYDVYGGEAFGIEGNGDLKRYKQILRGNGINLSGKAYILQAALANVFTWRLWESAWYNISYLGGANRKRKIFAWNIGEVEVTPPLINHYLTPSGGYYQGTFLINLKGPHGFEIGLGSDVDFVGAGELKHLRVGVEYSQLSLSILNRAISLKPFVHINVPRNRWGYSGHYFGFWLDVPLMHRLTFSIRQDYSRGDILENLVKQETKGYHTFGEVIWRY